MEQPPFFTIICACCDVAPYLQKMAESIKGQSFTDFECILVVEQSKDDTLQICKHLIEGDSRFSIVEQPRSGSPSAPRNTGLRLAKGKYAIYLDGDDYLTLDCLGKIADHATKHHFPDLIQLATEEWQDVPGGDPTFFCKYFNYRKKDHDTVITGPQATVLQGRQILFPAPMATLTICRVEFIRSNNLYFYHGLRHEDEEWTPRALFLAKSVLILDLVHYIYRRRADSITTMTHRADIKSIVKGLSTRIHFFCQHKIPADVAHTWQRTWLSQFFYHLFYNFSASKRNPKLLRLAVLRHALRTPESRAEFRKFAQVASLPKRIGMLLMLWCSRPNGFKSLFLCDLYFRKIYYPLVMWREKRKAK